MLRAAACESTSDADHPLDRSNIGEIPGAGADAGVLRCCQRPSTLPRPSDYRPGSEPGFKNGSRAVASRLRRATFHFQKRGCHIFYQPIANIGEPPNQRIFRQGFILVWGISRWRSLALILALTGRSRFWTSWASSSRFTTCRRRRRRAILKQSDTRVAYCEFVGARPTDAKVAAFAFGRARGVIEGVVGALGLPIVFLTPPTWKRIADIPPGVEHKDLARTRAIARWPTRADLFARKMDVDRAEACLIAIAGLRREAGR